METSRSPIPSFDSPSPTKHNFLAPTQKSILRQSTSSSDHREHKVRFSEAADRSGTHLNDTSAPSGPIPSSQNSWPHLGPAPTGAYQDPAYAAYAMAAANGGAYGPYPANAYYYGPYACAPYPQGWMNPPQTVADPSMTANEHRGAAGGPLFTQQPAAPAQTQDEGKRMQLLAKSVSITVNPATSTESGAGAPEGVSMRMAAPTSRELPPEATALLEHQWEERKLKTAIFRLNRSCLLRSFRYWGRLCEERWWKTQIELRDQQLQLLAVQLRHLEWRPVRYMRRCRLKAWFAAWKAYCARNRCIKAQIQHAEFHCRRASLCRVWTVWRSEMELEALEAKKESHARKVHQRRRRLAVLKAWGQQLGARAVKTAAKNAGHRHRELHLLRLAFGSWAHLAHYYASEKAAILNQMKQKLSRCFSGWIGWVRRNRGHDTMVHVFQGRHAVVIRQHAFFGWLAMVDGGHLRGAHALHAQLQEEIQRVRQENERLTRVIDSGEWGRERVAELTQAGQVLQQERNALLQLVESLPGSRLRRSTARAGVENTRGWVKPGKEESLSEPIPSARGSISFPGLSSDNLHVVGTAFTILPPNTTRKSIATDAGTTPSAKSTTTATTITTNRGPSAPSRAGTTTAVPAIVRNKLTVRAGSSFNALVRALKQDLLASGALARDPSAAFAVDQLATTRVEVVAGDGFRIEAVENTHCPGFTIPKAGSNNPQSSGKFSMDGKERGGRSVGILNPTSL